MPKFNESDYSELKQYLNYIINEKKCCDIVEMIENKDEKNLWNFIVGYKLIAHQLKKLTIDDPELAYLTGYFLGNYNMIESLYKKITNKDIKEIENVEEEQDENIRSKTLYLLREENKKEMGINE